MIIQWETSNGGIVIPQYPHQGGSLNPYIKAEAGSYIITHLLNFNIGFIVIFSTSFSFENGN